MCDANDELGFPSHFCLRDQLSLDMLIRANAHKTFMNNKKCERAMERDRERACVCVCLDMQSVMAPLLFNQFHNCVNFRPIFSAACVRGVAKLNENIFVFRASEVSGEQKGEQI